MQQHPLIARRRHHVTKHAFMISKPNGEQRNLYAKGRRACEFAFIRRYRANYL